jgi:REP element-mobilizing transposase RayT
MFRKQARPCLLHAEHQTPDRPSLQRRPQLHPHHRRDDRAPPFIDAVAAFAVREFQRLDREGFTRSIAYVVMPDHIHWLVELRAGTLETVMKRFKSRTAQQANRLLGRVGRFWQAAITIMRSALTNRCTGMRCT